MAITFVNSTAATKTAAASTWSIPTHSSRVGGSAFVVGLGPASSAVTVSTITDNTTNVYLKAIARPTPKPAAGAELWYAVGCSSLSTRISATLSGASSGSLAVGQWTGFSTLNALDVTGSSAITANSTSHSASEITPGAANALVVCFARVTASTIVPTKVSAGWSTWCSTLNAARTIGSYLIQSAASTATGSWTNGGAATSTGQCMHAEVIAAFSDTATALVFPGGGGSCGFMMMGVG